MGSTCPACPAFRTGTLAGGPPLLWREVAGLYDGEREELLTLLAAGNQTMTSPSRREKIEAMLQAEPGDAFLRYGLANEYDNEGRTEEAVALYQALMRDDPPHVPSFFRCAQLLVREDRVNEARALLRDGIEAARREGNAHAAGEMAELLASLGALGE
jgi:tetratricopeptide (TPR) repeat protein